MGLSPATRAFDLRAGESVTYTAVYSSAGNESFHARVSTRDAFRQPGGGYEFAEPGSEFWSAGNWLRVEPAEFDLQPNERQVLVVTVTVPKGTPDGEYYAAFGVLATPLVEGSSNPGVALQFSGEIVSVACVAIGENQVRSARLVPYGDVWSGTSQGLSPELGLGGRLKRWWLSLVINDRNVAPLTEGGALRAFAPLENTCGVHIQPRVTATFRRGETVVGETTVTGEIILPGERKVVEVPWASAPLLGVFDLDLKVEYDGPEPIEVTRRFLILPVKGLLGLIVVAFGLGYLVAARGRKGSRPTTPTPPVTGLPS